MSRKKYDLPQSEIQLSLLVDKTQTDSIPNAKRYSRRRASTPVPGVFDRQAYSNHIHSTKWKCFRDFAIMKAGNRCQRCEWIFKPDKLEVHHRHYDSLGNEKLEDVEVLCKKCHAKADEERAIRGRARSEEAYWDARFDGWASKVYGEEWRNYMDPNYVHDEFLDWLEYKADDY